MAGMARLKFAADAAGTRKQQDTRTLASHTRAIFRHDAAKFLG
jgi:hypothetical protein